MKQVHCDGCGATEPEDLVRSKKKIQEDVTIVVVRDPRGPDGTDKYVADLCPGCMALLLHTYFKIPMSEKLELTVPTFLVPEELKQVSAE
jgi:hypothetical protein